MARYQKPLVWPWLAGIIGLCGLSFLAVRVWRSVPASPEVLALADERLSDATAARAKTEAPGVHRSASTAVDQYVAPRFFAAAAPPVADRVESVTVEETKPAVELPPVPEEETGPLLVAARAPRRIEPLRNIRQNVPRQSSAPAPTSIHWPRPEALHNQLAELENAPPCAAWVQRVRRALERLEASNGMGGDEVLEVLAALEKAVEEGGNLVVMAEDPALWSNITRTCHGIGRRVEIWRRVYELSREERTLIVATVQPDVREALERVEQLIHAPQATELARAWRSYLLLDALRVVGSAPDTEPGARRDVARRVLNRMTAPTLTGAQRDFLAQTPFVALADQLRLWAYEPIDYMKFLAQIESCELRMVDGRTALAEDWQTLRWSPWRQTAELANLVEAYYRNANLRIAVSEDMLNRLLPDVHVMEEDVHDQILGARVNGRSLTFARLGVVLMPDKLNWRMGLVARGQVDSRTRSAKGPVTLFNSGATRYRARKLLTINRRGIRLEDAEVEAENSSRLMNVATEFDGLPLVGSLVRSIAVREHRELAPQVDAEVEHKVSARAAQRLDEEVQRKITDAQARYEQQLLEPLRKLHLNPVALEMQTTDERLIVRYRVAANHQLAAYTPRPQAPVDSVLSVQLNESLLNNMFGQLRLEGRSVALPTLFRELTTAMGKPDLPMPAEIREDVHIEFAKTEPVRVRFVEGQVILSLRIRTLTAGRDRWRDFEVHTRYAPVSGGREAWLVRDDFIELRGGRLGFRDRLPLRGIFTAVFAKERKLPLVGKKFVEHERLTDLGVTQLVLHDGWLGLAIGPVNRVAQRPESPAAP